MNDKDFNKIVIVSLCDSYSKKIGKLLSQNLGMIFCDAKDLVEYELIDKDALKEFCTKEYLEKSEKSVFEHIASFENVVVAINYDYLTKNYNILKNKGLIVFLKLTKQFVKDNGNVVDLISYESRTENLENLSTTIVVTKKTELNFVCNKILEKLGGIL